MHTIIKVSGNDIQIARFLFREEMLEHMYIHTNENWQELHGVTTLPTATYKRKHQQTPRPKADCTCHRELHTLQLCLASLVS